MAQASNDPSANPVTPIQPLMQQFPIVDPTTGKPSDYFMRYILNHSGQITTNTNDIGGFQSQITALQNSQFEGVDGVTITPSGGLLSEAPIVVGLSTTGVTAGSYTGANITVDAYGRITMAADGAAALTVEDGTTTVTNVNTIKFSGGTVTTPSTGEALVTITGGGGGSGGNLIKSYVATGIETYFDFVVPSNYTDLEITYTGNTSSGADIRYYINGDYVDNHYYYNIWNKYGNGQGPVSRIGSGSGDSAHTHSLTHKIPGYNRTGSKTGVGIYGYWANDDNYSNLMESIVNTPVGGDPSPITALRITTTAGTFIAGTVVSLFGYGSSGGSGGVLGSTIVHLRHDFNLSGGWNLISGFVVDHDPLVSYSTSDNGVFTVPIGCNYVQCSLQMAYSNTTGDRYVSVSNGAAGSPGASPRILGDISSGPNEHLTAATGVIVAVTPGQTFSLQVIGPGYVGSDDNTSFMAPTRMQLVWYSGYP